MISGFPASFLDKTSWLRPRHVETERGQAYEPEVPVKVRDV
jgi:hypothetical protein